MEKITESRPVTISISVVSHGQMDMVMDLMQDIHAHCHGQAIELILTLNIHEVFTVDEHHFFYPITVIRNTVPQGFGANHNQAFRVARGDYFCVLNPDIRLDVCPFQALLGCLEEVKIGIVAPRVLNPSGTTEDSARRFPTLKKIMGKLVKKTRSIDYALGDELVDVDWVAGMFMLFPHAVFENLKGFNERYFLYYEDVDICARLHLIGLRVVVDPGSCVVHHAQRRSHRSLRYLRWHVGSMLRFLCSAEYRQLKSQHRL